MIRDSMVFLRSQWEGVHDLPEDRRLAAYEAIFGYAFDGKEPEMVGAEMAFMRQIMAQTDSNNERYMNGKKGGAPKGNKNASKKQPKQPVVESKTTYGCFKNNLPIYDEDVDVDVDVDGNVFSSGKPDPLSPAAEIIHYLNRSAGRAFQLTETNLALVGNLLGTYPVRALEMVIDNKVAQWKTDPKMAGYLRPKTLFDPANFENYINEEVE